MIYKSTNTFSEKPKIYLCVILFVSWFKNDSTSCEDVDVFDDFEFVDFSSFYGFANTRKTCQKMRKELLYKNKSKSSKQTETWRKSTIWYLIFIWIFLRWTSIFSQLSLYGDSVQICASIFPALLQQCGLNTPQKFLVMLMRYCVW